MTVLQGRRPAPFEIRRAAASGRLQIAPSIIRLAAPAGADGDAADLLRDRRRRRIWDINASLHCSIIGTCLSTAELRSLLIRLQLGDAETASDHDLHGQGVLLARNRDAAAKVLNKALDRRHQLAINQLAKVRSEADVAAFWSDAVKRGDIPGAYWAVLTHPDTGEALLRRVFGEVHMLSHLVGAANRADIRRLHQLEQENAELLAKIERQQAQLRDALVVRDAKLRELSDALARRIEAEAGGTSLDETPAQSAALCTVIAGLERKLAAETARRERAERRLGESTSARAEAEAAGRHAAQERDALREELAAAEESLGSLLDDGGEERMLDLRGMSVLYIGGRPNQIDHLRAVSERASARFLHHDGGVDERSGLLPGLISRADIAMFPVDCVSHEAALMVKRLCRQSGKPWIPLRTASVTAFLAALAPMLSAVSGAKSPASLSS
jgi:hypothetical protein